MLKMIIAPPTDKVSVPPWVPSLRLKCLSEAQLSTPDVAAIFTAPKGDEAQLPTNQFTHKFLVVDDNEIYLRIFSRILLKLFPCATVDVLQLSTAVDINMLLNYHIVFLDIEMPDVTGVDIAKSVRSCPSLDSVGLIAVTTRHLLKDLQEYQSCGFDHTFPKPVGLRRGEVLEEIRKVLRSRCGYVY